MADPTESSSNSNIPVGIVITADTGQANDSLTQMQLSLMNLGASSDDTSAKLFGLSSTQQTLADSSSNIANLANGVATAFGSQHSSGSDLNLGITDLTANTTILAQTLEQYNVSSEISNSKEKSHADSIENLNHGYDQLKESVKRTTDAIDKTNFAKTALTVAEATDALKLGIVNVSIVADSFSQTMDKLDTKIQDLHLTGIHEGLEKIHGEFGGTMADQAAAMFHILQTGAEDTDEAIQQLDASNRLAIGTMQTIPDAANAVAASVAAYGDKGITAAKASDLLTVAMQKISAESDGAKPSLEDMGEGISDNAAIAVRAGVSLQEYLAATVALTDKNTSASVAMAHVSKAIDAIVNPTQKAREEADKLHLRFDESSLSAEHLTGFLSHLRTVVGNNSGEMRALFGDTDAYRVVMRLTGTQAETFKTTLDGMQNSSLAANEAMKKNIDSVAEVNKRIAASFTDLQNEIGVIFLPLTNAIARLTAGSADLISKHHDIALAVGASIAVLGGVAAVSGYASTALSALSMVTGGATSSMLMMGATATASVTSIQTSTLLAVAAFGGLGYAIYRLIEANKEVTPSTHAVAKATDDVSVSIDAMVTSVEQAATTLKNEVVSLVDASGAVQSLEDNYDAISNAISRFVQTLPSLDSALQEINKELAYCDDVVNSLKHSYLAIASATNTWIESIEKEVDTFLVSHAVYATIISDYIAIKDAVDNLIQTLPSLDSALQEINKEFAYCDDVVNSLKHSYLAIASATNTWIESIEKEADTFLTSHAVYATIISDYITIKDAVDSFIQTLPSLGSALQAINAALIKDGGIVGLLIQEYKDLALAVKQYIAANDAAITKLAKESITANAALSSLQDGLLGTIKYATAIRDVMDVAAYSVVGLSDKINGSTTIITEAITANGDFYNSYTPLEMAQIKVTKTLADFVNGTVYYVRAAAYIASAMGRSYIESALAADNFTNSTKQSTKSTGDFVSMAETLKKIQESSNVVNFESVSSWDALKISIGAAIIASTRWITTFSTTTIGYGVFASLIGTKIVPALDFLITAYYAYEAAAHGASAADVAFTFSLGAASAAFDVYAASLFAGTSGYKIYFAAASTATKETAALGLGMANVGAAAASAATSTTFLGRALEGWGPQFLIATVGLYTAGLALEKYDEIMHDSSGSVVALAKNLLDLTADIGITAAAIAAIIAPMAAFTAVTAAISASIEILTIGMAALTVAAIAVAPELIAITVAIGAATLAFYEFNQALDATNRTFTEWAEHAGLVAASVGVLGTSIAALVFKQQALALATTAYAAASEVAIPATIALAVGYESLAFAVNKFDEVMHNGDKPTLERIADNLELVAAIGLTAAALVALAYSATITTAAMAALGTISTIAIPTMAVLAAGAANLVPQFLAASVVIYAGSVAVEKYDKVVHSANETTTEWAENTVEFALALGVMAVAIGVLAASFIGLTTAATEQATANATAAVAKLGKTADTTSEAVHGATHATSVLTPTVDAMADAVADAETGMMGMGAASQTTGEALANAIPEGTTTATAAVQELQSNVVRLASSFDGVVQRTAAFDAEGLTFVSKVTTALARLRKVNTETATIFEHQWTKWGQILGKTSDTAAAQAVDAITAKFEALQAANPGIGATTAKVAALGTAMAGLSTASNAASKDTQTLAANVSKTSMAMTALELVGIAAAGGIAALLLPIEAVGAIIGVAALALLAYSDNSDAATESTKKHADAHGQLAPNLKSTTDATNEAQQAIDNASDTTDKNTLSLNNVIFAYANASTEATNFSGAMGGVQSGAELAAAANNIIAANANKVTAAYKQQAAVFDKNKSQWADYYRQSQSVMSIGWNYLSNVADIAHTLIHWTVNASDSTQELYNWTQKQTVGADENTQATNANALAKQKQIAILEKAIFDEGQEISKLQASEKIRELNTKAIEDEFKARTALGDIAKQEIDLLAIALAAKQAEYEASERATEAAQKKLTADQARLTAIMAEIALDNTKETTYHNDIETLTQAIDVDKEKVESTKAMTEQSRIAVLASQVASESYGDQSDNVDKLRAAYNAVKHANDELVESQRGTSQTQKALQDAFTAVSNATKSASNAQAALDGIMHSSTATTADKTKAETANTKAQQALTIATKNYETAQEELTPQSAALAQAHRDLDVTYRNYLQDLAVASDAEKNLNAIQHNSKASKEEIAKATTANTNAQSLLTIATKQYQQAQDKVNKLTEESKHQLPVLTEHYLAQQKALALLLKALHDVTIKRKDEMDTMGSIVGMIKKEDDTRAIQLKDLAEEAKARGDITAAKDLDNQATQASIQGLYNEAAGKSQEAEAAQVYLVALQKEIATKEGPLLEADKKSLIDASLIVQSKYDEANASVEAARHAQELADAKDTEASATEAATKATTDSSKSISDAAVILTYYIKAINGAISELSALSAEAGKAATHIVWNSASAYEGAVALDKLEASAKKFTDNKEEIGLTQKIDELNAAITKNKADIEQWAEYSRKNLTPISAYFGNIIDRVRKVTLAYQEQALAQAKLDLGSQELADKLKKLAATLADGDTGLAQYKAALEELEGQYQSLGKERLQGIRDALKSAIELTQQLEQSAASALQSAMQAADETLGMDNKAMEENIAWAATKAELQKQLAEAQKSQDGQAIINLTKAMNLQQQVHNRKMVNIEIERTAVKESQVSQQLDLQQTGDIGKAQYKEVGQVAAEACPCANPDGQKTLATHESGISAQLQAQQLVNPNAVAPSPAVAPNKEEASNTIPSKSESSPIPPAPPQPSWASFDPHAIASQVTEGTRYALASVMPAAVKVFRLDFSIGNGKTVALYGDDTHSSMIEQFLSQLEKSRATTQGAF